MSNLQAKLDALKSLPPARVSAMAPAWAKPKPIKPFVPDLRQFIPIIARPTVMTNVRHRAWIFSQHFKVGCMADGPAYVAAWDEANRYVPCETKWITPSGGSWA